jgi:hypothetical protein
MDMDNNNILWLATEMALVRFDPVTYSIENFDETSGIENDYICAVICDSSALSGFLLMQVFPVLILSRKNFVNYGIADGLSNSAYYTRNKYYSPDGIIYFGGKNGVDYFHPDQLRKNTTAPLMYLSGITIDNQRKLSAQDISAAGELKLTPRNNLIEIDFIGLTLCSSKRGHVSIPSGRIS